MNRAQTLCRPAAILHCARDRSVHLRPVRVLKQGTSLFRETDPADHLYEVRSGVLRLTRLIETGRRQVVAFAHPGTVVGFPAGGLHHADCEALQATTVVVHRKEMLDDPMVEPDLHRHLQKAALSEIADLQDHLLLMARKGACGKLASFFLRLAERHGEHRTDAIMLDLPMPRADIADYLCMTVETVSRSLGRMRDLEIIRLDAVQTIAILDPEALQDMASAE